MPLLFAYGSCMDENDIARTVKVKYVGTAKLQDHTLGFTRLSINRKCGVADIVSRPGHYVEGVLMDVEDFENLDIREGHPNSYHRKFIQVRNLKNSELVIATAYVVREKLVEEIQPSEEYLDLIRAGAQNFLSEEYQQFLEINFTTKRKAVLE